MRFSIHSLVLGLFLLNALVGFSQDEKYKNAVKVSEIQRLPSGNLKVGDVVELVYKLKISDGFHVYCASQPTKRGGQPALFELLPGTSGVEPVGGLQDGPERQVHRDDVFRVDVAEYHGSGTLTQKVKITSDKPVLKAKLKYQVCDENLCQYVDYPINASFKVGAGASGPTPPTNTPPLPPVVTPSKEPKSAAEKAKFKADSIAKVKAKADSAAQAAATPEAKPAEVDETAILNKVFWSSPVVEPNTKPKKGDIITLIFKAKIEKNYHLYSAIPPKQQANLPTTFDFIAGETKGAEIEGALLEEGNKKTKFDEVFKTDVAYFEDSVIFKQKIKITEDNPVIKGFINYQVCDSTKCIPAKNDFAMSWESTGDVISDADAGDSLWTIFWKSLGLGLAAVFTPCVFPMIPLTVSFFTKRSGSRAKGIFNALFYGLSIIGIYTVLGLLVSILFGADTMQAIAINKWVNVVFFLLLVVFAFSFLGWFEITLPASWSTAMRVKSQSQGMSLAGIFLMALTLAIVSFSCTGPLVGAAMAQAASGKSYISPTVAMLGFSSAIAFPFSLFALFPNWLSSMPKSGGWMNTIKVVLGFLELALALTYLSNADLVAHWGILPRDIFIAIWIATFGLLGGYLIGKIQLPHDSPVDKISVPRLMAALASFSVVIYLIPGLWGQTLPIFEGILPPAKKGSNHAFVSGENSGGSAATSTSKNEICNYPNKKSAHLNEHTPEGICAFYDIDQALEYAKANNKPVFMDFTGHTCKNCRKVEQTIWTDPEVTKMLTEDFVLVSLYTDDDIPLPKPETSADGKTTLTTVGNKWQEYQKINYNFNAQPYYVLIDHEKKTLTQPFAYMSDKEQYKKNMRDALAEFKKRKGA